MFGPNSQEKSFSKVIDYFSCVIKLSRFAYLLVTLTRLLLTSYFSSHKLLWLLQPLTDILELHASLGNSVMSCHDGWFLLDTFFSFILIDV